MDIKKLKEYCKYLIEEYKKSNPNFLESSLYHDLVQFDQEDRIKDLIEIDDSFEKKCDVLETYRKDIQDFKDLI